MILNLIQPIATLHNADGTLKAVRVFRAKVEYTGDICPKVSSERKLVRFADIVWLAITHWVEQGVIDISMTDVTKYKQARNVIIDKTISSSVRGAYYLPAIKADGTVLDANIYQAVGSIHYSSVENGVTRSLYAKEARYISVEPRIISMPDARFIDYTGTVYTAQQLMQRVPLLRDVVSKLISGTLDAATMYSAIQNMCEHNTAGIGNIMDLLPRYSEPQVTIHKEKYQAASYTNALSTIELMVPDKNKQYTFVSDLADTVWQYNLDTADSPLTASRIAIPQGFAAANINAGTIQIHDIIAPDGLLLLHFIGDILPSVKTTTPMLNYFVHVRTNGSDVILPPMQSTPASDLSTSLTCWIKQPTYINKPVDLSKGIADAAKFEVKLNGQLCPVLTIPVAGRTDFSTGVSAGKLTLIAKRGIWKYRRKERKTQCFCEFVLSHTSRQQVLLNFEDCDNTTEVFACIKHDSANMIPIPCGGDVKLLLNKERFSHITLAENINVTIFNKVPNSSLEIAYSHFDPALRDISTAVVAAAVDSLYIIIQTIANARYTLILADNVQHLHIYVHSNNDITAEELAKSLVIRTNCSELNIDTVQTGTKIWKEPCRNKYKQLALCDIK